MKRTLTIVLVSIVSTLFFLTSAQVCRISKEGDSVEVLSSFRGDSKVTVTVGNDSQNLSANVTVTIKATYKWGDTKEKIFTGRCLAKPSSETKLEISVPEKDGNYSFIGYTIESISGTKCITD